MPDSLEPQLTLDTSDPRRPRVLASVLLGRRGRRTHLPVKSWVEGYARARDAFRAAGAVEGGDRVAIPVEALASLGASAGPFPIHGPFPGVIDLSMPSAASFPGFRIVPVFKMGQAVVKATARCGAVHVPGKGVYTLIPCLAAFVDALTELNARPESMERRDAYLGEMHRLLGLGEEGGRNLRISQATRVSCRWREMPGGELQLHPELMEADGAGMFRTAGRDLLEALVDGHEPTGVPRVLAVGSSRVVMSDEVLDELDIVRGIRRMPAELRRDIPHGPAADAFPPHVLGYGPWTKPEGPAIPRIPRRYPAEWVYLPLDGHYRTLSQTDAALLGDDIAGARADGTGHVAVDAVRIPFAEAEALLPAIDAQLQGRRQEIVEGIGEGVPLQAPTDPTCADVAADRKAVRGGDIYRGVDRYGLASKTNFNDVQYLAVATPRGGPGWGDAAATAASLLSVTPEPHQAAAIMDMARCWVEGEPGFLVCDEPGTGKTVSVAGVLAWLRTRNDDVGTCLYVTTSDLVERTRDHIEALLPGSNGKPLVVSGKGLSPVAAPGLKAGAVTERILQTLAAMRASPLCVMSYETLAILHVHLAQVRLGVVVTDEAQRLRNYATFDRNCCASLNCGMRVVVTGSPIENGMEDLWSLVDLARPGYLGSLRDYVRHAYGTEGERPVVDHEFAAEVTDSLLRPEGGARIMSRTLKADAMGSLPAPEYVRRRIPMPPPQAEAYGAALAGFRTRDGRVVIGLRETAKLLNVSLHPDTMLDMGAIGVTGAARWMARSARLGMLAEAATAVAAAGEKMIVLCHSTKMMGVLQEVLPALVPSAACWTLNGTVRQKDRPGRMEAFRSHPGAAFLLLTARVGGTGHDIFEARHVFLLERGWNPQAIRQVVDRAYRMGQTGVVKVYVPSAVYEPDRALSADLHVDLVLERKLEEQSRMFLPDRDGQEEEAFAGARRELEARERQPRSSRGLRVDARNVGGMPAT